MQLARCSSSRIEALAAGEGFVQNASSTPLAPDVTTPSSIRFPFSLNRLIVTPMASKSSGWGARHARVKLPGIRRLSSSRGLGAAWIACRNSSATIQGRRAAKQLQLLTSMRASVNIQGYISHDPPASRILAPFEPFSTAWPIKFPIHGLIVRHRYH